MKKPKKTPGPNRPLPPLDRSDRIAIAPSNYLGPVPATLVSCAREGERPNIITIAWNGTINSKPPMLSISVTKERYSYDIIKESGEFVVNIPDLSLAKALDYCGVKSFRDTDKFADLDLTTEKMPELNFAPAIAEAPLSIGCQVKESHFLGSHEIFLAEIVSAKVRKSLVTEEGALHPEDAGLIAYIHGDYFSLGDWLGFFGWSIARPDILERRTKEALKRKSQPKKKAGQGKDRPRKR